jgi:hypothetical protein
MATAVKSWASQALFKRRSKFACRPSRRCTAFFAALAAAQLSAGTASAGDAASPPRLFTHQSYVEDVLRHSSLQVDDPKAVFAFVLNSLPDRVKVYPTENYYYFRFVHQGAQYAGNVRLDSETRDHGKIHIAYSIDFAEWKDEDPAFHELLGQKDGVIVEKLDRLVYRVSYGSKSVVFELNDLSDVIPPATALAPDERYIGPIFDDSAVRFFLVYNSKLKLFLYILDETVPPTDRYEPAAATDHILIGKRTGFAFYRDHRLDRKILIGVFEGNSRVNNYFDGPFDQLPDNFIKGEALRSAILEVEPRLAGQIDRFGSDPDGSTRYMISPYMHYRSEDELTVFHKCAESKTIPADLYYGCFLVEPEDEGSREARSVSNPKVKPKVLRTKKTARIHTQPPQR